MGWEGIRGRMGARAGGKSYPHIHRIVHPRPGPYPRYRRLISTRRGGLATNGIHLTIPPHRPTDRGQITRKLTLGVCRIQAASNPYAGKSQPIGETRTRYSRKFRVNRAKGDVCCPHLTAKRDQSDRLLGVCRIQAASNPYAGKSQPIGETRTRYSRKFRVNRAKGGVCCLHLTAKRDQSDRLLVRMIAYRAETRMMAPVITTQGKKPNARGLLRALLTSDANIIPVPAKGILRIQLLGLGSDACDRMLAPLVEELNATRTIYPGTDLRLVYELAGDPPPEVSPDSG